MIFSTWGNGRGAIEKEMHTWDLENLKEEGKSERDLKDSKQMQQE